MFNLSSPQDQVSKFIVKITYSVQNLKFTFKFRIKPQCMTQKLSIASITPSLKAFLLNKNAFQRLKITHYPSIICSNNSV